MLSIVIISPDVAVCAKLTLNVFVPSDLLSTISLPVNAAKVPLEIKAYKLGLFAYLS